MAAIKLIVLSLACVCATALSPTAPVQVTRNTIFADERYEGEVFEHVDAFDDIELTNTDVAISPYRLPTTTAPLHYRVHWIIDPAALRYSGSVEITLYATEPDVNEIVIHCDHLTITNLTLTQGTTVIPSNHTLQREYHFLRVSITNGVLQWNGNPLNPVQYILRIEFNANMRDDMYGIYHSWYKNVGTDIGIRWMATTQFQATAARYALPCYDEPSFKATFFVIISRPIGYSSWFCTSRQLTEPNANLPGYEDDVYHMTPIMSTYLLALIVAEYAVTDTPQLGNPRHEVIARPGAINSGQGVFAQQLGQQLLAQMEINTGYDFLSQNVNLKMTQAAIPDFGAGAMENWGLLTYREAYLLRDPVDTNGYFEQLIAYILSHEIAHMWFGNLVTNHWWDVLWLNEGFARYYQYFLTDAIRPDMGLKDRFINEQVHVSLLTDSSNNPQPLTNPGVGSPAAVSAMFGTLTYNKGAAVIRMTEHLLGTNVHTVGLRAYLRENHFRTVQPINLFNALDTAGRSAQAFTAYGSDFNFVDYYKSWTEQPGHPVLDVEINQTTGLMTITQRRFNINTGYSSQNTQYIVPITFATEINPNFESTKPSHVLRKSVNIIDRDAYGDFWTILNVQQTGYYRVNYDSYSWDLIIRALRSDIERPLIHEYNRAQIVNDVFQFARSGLMTYRRAMNILYFLRQEDKYTPWVTAITGFNWLRTRLHGTPLLDRLDAEILQWSTFVIGQLQYQPTTGENFMTSYLRYQIAPFLCNLGAPACIAAARTQFDTMKNGGAVVPADSRNWVYCNALRRGDPEDFNYLWNRFLTHNVYTEKILLLQTLGCTSDPASLHRFLDAIFQSNNIIRRQDYNTALNSAVSGNEENTQLVFDYMKQNLPTVINAYGSASTPLSYVSGRLRTPEQVHEFQLWANESRAILNTSYNAVYNGAQNTLQSFSIAPTIIPDLSTFFEPGGVEEVIVTTAAPPPTTGIPVTSARPNLVQPTTPEFPASASASVTTFVSIFLLTCAALAHIIL